MISARGFIRGVQIPEKCRVYTDFSNFCDAHATAVGELEKTSKIFETIPLVALMGIVMYAKIRSKN